MIDALATELAIGLAIGIIYFLLGVIDDLGRRYFSTRTTVPIV
jgi:hypothetical protein